MEERLQKILAHAGLGSRRACEELIRQGRVAVNGQVAQIGQKADPNRDRITLDGKPVQARPERTYVALHKPKGVLSDEGDGTGPWVGPGTGGRKPERLAGPHQVGGVVDIALALIGIEAWVNHHVR